MENELVVPQSTGSVGRQQSAEDTAVERLPEDKYFREVVAAVLAGRTERFEEIVNLFRHRIYGIAWHTTQDAEDALDITQDVFLRVFRALKSWRGRARFSTWLHRIAVNASIDYIRRQARHRDRSESFDDMAPERSRAVQADLSPEVESPRRQAYSRELRREILAAIRRLPDRQKRCFVLRHYHDCSIREIGAVLNISEGAVKRHLHRAARKLRKDLAGRLGMAGGT